MDWSSITPAVVLAVGSLVTALCSMFIALSNYRRSNYAVVRVLDSGYSGGMEIGRGHYDQFRIVVQNLGIPLQNVGMTLRFTETDGFGTFTTPLKTKDGKLIREGQFAKGAVTEFIFATDKMDDGDAAFLGRLTDLKGQCAGLHLHADKYGMWSYRLHDRLWWLKRRWNRFAFWLTWSTRREVTTSRGTKGVKHRVRLPEYTSPGQHLIQFASVVRQSPPRVQKQGWPTQPEPVADR